MLIGLILKIFVAVIRKDVSDTIYINSVTICFIFNDYLLFKKGLWVGIRKMQWILHTRESAITSVRQKKKDEKRKEGNKKKGSIVEGII